jgi:hypothetical protein
MNQSNGCAQKQPSRFSSLEKVQKGGIPEIANEEIKKVTSSDSHHFFSIHPFFSILFTM